ncbi:tetratricopeptide repeat protein [Legionella yabuuchiae]|uniref:tetratricopeptide repeat protein n=1 Tax=Legionella yabuuchiae TaxID=376727 RepID=UPI0010554F68|nr:tetratricopeptide repeat protein [Legionella yabuuchiae]
MSNWLFILIGIVLLTIAFCMVFYPLRLKKSWILGSIPVLILLITSAYWQWGGWVDWQAYLTEQNKQQQVQEVLKSIKSPQELILKLKARVDNNPNDPRGWYLLGRLYTTQESWVEANQAFKRAYALNPDDIPITINYAQSQWQMNHHQFNEPIRALFSAVLTKQPNQPDALAMLAMDSFMSHDYEQAIHYWQRLLSQAHPDSEDAQAIRKAIVKAQNLNQKTNGDKE